MMAGDKIQSNCASAFALLGFGWTGELRGCWRMRWIGNVVGRRQRRCFRMNFWNRKAHTPATASRRTSLASRLSPNVIQQFSSTASRLSYHVAMKEELTQLLIQTPL